ncbi:MAG: hypothetical protein H6536_08360 [Bacteroidales bacterium]|nr:hypothetical protein [Bacteroidales bacterium]
MKTDFICPKCGGHLLVGDSIIFSASNSEGEKGLILLSPHLGDYTRTTHPSFTIKSGSTIDYFCPLCKAHLGATEVHHQLVHLIMIDENGEKQDVYFSGIEGEMCTYKVSDKSIEKYGPASENYLKYFAARHI